MNIPLTSRNNLLIIGLAVILSLSVLALMFPYRISLFQPLVCLLFVSFLFVRRKIQLTWMIIPFLVIGALYGIPFLFSYNFAGGVATRDFVNMLSVSLLALLFFNIITEEQDWNTFFSTFSKIVVVITTLVSVIGFIKFHYLMRGCQFSFFTGDGEDYQNGTTLVYDYNYYALGGIIGVLFCFSLMKRYRAGTPKVYLAVMGMINLMNVLLSGSRRGFMLMMIIILVYIAEAIFRMITRRISKTALTIFIVSAALSVCSVLLAFSYVVRTDIQQKQRVAVSLGYDKIEMPLALARLTFRYSTVFFPSAPSANIYKYFVSKELLDFEKQKKTLYDQRREKWAYSIELFNAFPRTQKIWGEGFHYLKQFEEKFQKEEKVQDYPHNYLLSALLYSGLLGMVVFVIYLILCGLLYLKHIKKISVLFWIFLITQVFAFTSGNSIFTEKLSCFLLVVPFLIEKVFAESKETVKISKS